MHIHIVPNRGSPPTVLLRESYREGTKVRKRTLANLSSLSATQIEAMRAALPGQALQPAPQSLEITASRAHGHVQAVTLAMQRLGLAALLGTKPSRERDLVLAMVAARILAPHTKLATTRWWHTTTLAAGLRRGRRERGRPVRGDGLAARSPGRDPEASSPHVIFTRAVWCSTTCRRATSRAATCPLAKLGYNRDGKQGPAAGQLRAIHRRARLSGGRVGPRGQCGRQRDPHARGAAAARGLRHRTTGDGGRPRHDLPRRPSRSCAGWPASAGSRRSRASRSACSSSKGSCSWGCSTSAISSSSARRTIPGERLVACRNPELARLRAHKREALLAATEKSLQAIKQRVDAGKLAGADAIGLRVGKVINQYKVAKHFELAIGDASLTFARKHDAIAAEAALDGIYIIRTSLDAQRNGCARLRAQLQVAGQRGAGVPLLEDGGPEGAPDPPPHRPIGCARTSSCACSPTTSSGTSARPGAS